MTTINITDYLENPSAYFLVDVRTPNEFSEAHIHEASSRPLDSISPETLKKEAGDRKVLFSCLSGARAAKAAQKCTSIELETYVLDGCLQQWELKGHPVVRSTPKGLPLIRQVHLALSIINLAAALLTLFVNPQWAWVIVGTSVGLFLAGATGFCGMGLLLAKMPWNK